ncbi:hypothetical protein H9P43_004683 [Blastocladiella emersonii ATCC 22665]|nr:hypothetical protein H9P43_004683 [Blastocladiella emersonii ATCC 22665]
MTASPLLVLASNPSHVCAPASASTSASTTCSTTAPLPPSPTVSAPLALALAAAPSAIAELASCLHACRATTTTGKSPLCTADCDDDEADSAFNSGDDDEDEDDVATTDSGVGEDEDDEDELDGASSCFAPPALAPAVGPQARRTVRFAASEVSATYAMHAADEYDRCSDDPVARLRYADVAEMMALKSLMRRQHAMIAAAPGADDAVCAGCDKVHACAATVAVVVAAVPTLEDMAARGL